jgi:hypothetical protein
MDWREKGLDRIKRTNGVKGSTDSWMDGNQPVRRWTDGIFRCGTRRRSRLSSWEKIALRRVGEMRTVPRHGFSFDTTVCLSLGFGFLLTPSSLQVSFDTLTFLIDVTMTANRPVVTFSVASKSGRRCRRSLTADTSPPIVVGHDGAASVVGKQAKQFRVTRPLEEAHSLRQFFHVTVGETTGKGIRRRARRAAMLVAKADLATLFNAAMRNCCCFSPSELRTTGIRMSKDESQSELCCVGGGGREKVWMDRPTKATLDRQEQHQGGVVSRKKGWIPSF